MKKYFLIAITILFTLTLAGCQSYKNSNELPEGDGFTRPEGIEMFEDYLVQINNKYKITYEDGSIIYFDGSNIIDDEDNMEVYDIDKDLFYVYSKKDGIDYRDIVLDSIYSDVFDFRRARFEDYTFDENNECYNLKSEKVTEFGKDINVSFDSSISNFVFKIGEEKFITQPITKSFIEPTEFEINIHNIDKIYALFEGKDSYKCVEEVIFSQVSYYDSFHTANKSSFKYSVNTQYKYSYVDYVDGSFVVKDENDINVDLHKDYFFCLNMFVVDTGYNQLDLIEESYYDAANNMYRLEQNFGDECWWKFNSDYTEFTFYSSVLDFNENNTRQYKFSDFGNITEDDVNSLLPSSTTYTNLIK